MGWLSAHLFSRVQAAAFYQQLHQEAVALLPPGNGQAWFDVGCGPGLIARLATAYGYRATGFDIDPDMLRRAKLYAAHAASLAQFEVAGLADLAAQRRTAHVVSAGSLLVVLPDRQQGLSLLWSCVSNGGTLLLIEPSDRMTMRAAWALQRRRHLGPGAVFLNLWALTRDPGRVIGWDHVRLPGCETRRHELLDGLVNAWVIQRSPSSVHLTG